MADAAVESGRITILCHFELPPDTFEVASKRVSLSDTTTIGQLERSLEHVLEQELGRRFSISHVYFQHVDGVALEVRGALECLKDVLYRLQASADAVEVHCQARSGNIDLAGYIRRFDDLDTRKQTFVIEQLLDSDADTGEQVSHVAFQDSSLWRNTIWKSTVWPQRIRIAIGVVRNFSRCPYGWGDIILSAGCAMHDFTSRVWAAGCSAQDIYRGFSKLCSKDEGELIASDSVKLLLLIDPTDLPSIRADILQWRDNHTRTLLHLAALNGCLELCKRLVALGAGMYWDSEGNTPLDVAAGLAASEEHRHVVRFFREQNTIQGTCTGRGDAYAEAMADERPVVGVRWHTVPVTSGVAAWFGVVHSLLYVQVADSQTGTSHAYIIEKSQRCSRYADDDAEEYRNGVHVSHWQDVSLQVGRPIHALGFEDLKQDFGQQPLTMRTLRDLAVDLGPYDPVSCNCHQTARFVYNVSANPAAAVHSIPELLHSIGASALQRVDSDLDSTRLRSPSCMLEYAPSTWKCSEQPGSPACKCAEVELFTAEHMQLGASMQSGYQPSTTSGISSRSTTTTSSCC